LYTSFSLYSPTRHIYTLFPTRRSSDLCCDHLNSEADARQLAAGCDLGQGAQWLAGVGADEKLHLLQAEGHVVAFCGGLELNAELDRKSTRLNSSHVKISYAVFCLKKKI